MAFQGETDVHIERRAYSGLLGGNMAMSTDVQRLEEHIDLVCWCQVQLEGGFEAKLNLEARDCPTVVCKPKHRALEVFAPAGHHGEPLRMLLGWHVRRCLLLDSLLHFFQRRSRGNTCITASQKPINCMHWEGVWEGSATYHFQRAELSNYPFCKFDYRLLRSSLA